MDTFLNILVKAHSGWRWVVLILFLAAIVKMHIGWKKNKPFTSGDKKLALFTMIAFHTQYLFGWILYFVSTKVSFGEGWMKNEMFRFYGLEHILMMTIAMICITIGYSKSKKKETAVLKFKSIAVYYTIAFALTMVMIPWPFRTGLNGGWF